jgi:magnesium chelatase family protein
LDVFQRPGTRWELIGFGERILRESPQRVRHAWRSTGRTWPSGKWVIGLSPSAVPKSGASFDLPLALGIALAQRPDCTLRIWALGELHLDGRVLPIPGASHLVHFAKEARADWIVLPKSGSDESAGDTRIHYVENLEQVLKWVDALIPLANQIPAATKESEEHSPVDFSAFQLLASSPSMQWLALVAAHGKHHALVCVNPETDWMVFAKALHELTMAHEGLQTAKEIPLRLSKGLLSLSAGIGTGADALLEEITGAHGGVLAIGRWHDQDPRLDDVLSGPLEKGSLSVGRGAGTWLVPADFQLVLATSTCPCGPIGNCICRSHQIQSRKVRFRKAMVDHIDAVTYWKTDQANPSLSATEAMQKLKKAAHLARLRNGSDPSKWMWNKDLPLNRILELGVINKSVIQWLETEEAKRKVPISRVAHLLRVARSLADLDGKQIVDLEHIKQSLQWNDAFG